MLRPLMSQTQTLSLRQELIPAQIQSLEILQATIPELEQKISELLAENPTLELVGTGTEELVGNPTEGDVPSPPTAAEAERESAESGDGRGGERIQPASETEESFVDRDESAGGLAAELEQIEESWREFMPAADSGHEQMSEEAEERRQYRFDSLVAPITLQEKLIEQFRQLGPFAEKEQALGEEIIGSIDETGYLRSHIADIAMSCGVELHEVSAMLTRIQQLDPPGVGARDLRECLLLQLERANRRDSLEYRVVSKYLHEVARNQIPKVARALRISPARLYDVMREIRRLSPFPGTQVTSADNTVSVMAEVTISKNEQGVWQVEPNREYRPRLRLSSYYLQLIRDPAVSPETRRYVREKLTESKLLLRAIANRQSTIERISWSLLKFQRDFFELGPDHLQPLTLTQVARELGLHETTISRAVANKYAHTPQGVLELRFFFSEGSNGPEGADTPLLVLKRKVRKLIEEENARHPLTDDQIAATLHDQGIQLTRRTVAKNREDMNIPSTHQRRKRD